MCKCRDFDPAETVKEKMAKISEVKGVKGLRKLMKEIAVTGVTGKHDNEMIGCVNIPFKVSCYPPLVRNQKFITAVYVLLIFLIHSLYCSLFFSAFRLMGMSNGMP